METADSETFVHEPRNRAILKGKNALVKYVYSDTSANEDNSFRNHIR